MFSNTRWYENSFFRPEIAWASDLICREYVVCLEEGGQLFHNW